MKNPAPKWEPVIVHGKEYVYREGGFPDRMGCENCAAFGDKPLCITLHAVGPRYCCHRGSHYLTYAQHIAERMRNAS